MAYISYGQPLICNEFVPPIFLTNALRYRARTHSVAEMWWVYKPWPWPGWPRAACSSYRTSPSGKCTGTRPAVRSARRTRRWRICCRRSRPCTAPARRNTGRTPSSWRTRPASSSSGWPCGTSRTGCPCCPRRSFPADCSTSSQTGRPACGRFVGPRRLISSALVSHCPPPTAIAGSPG